MRIFTLSLIATIGVIVLTTGPGITISTVHATNTNPPGTKESKPATSTMSGTEQQGSNAGRNANTKPTAPPAPPKK
jgi:hypothetical protein